MLDSLVAWLAAVSRGISLDELAEALAENLDSRESLDVELIVSAEILKAPDNHGDLDGHPLMFMHT